MVGMVCMGMRRPMQSCFIQQAAAAAACCCHLLRQHLAARSSRAAMPAAG
jgi:hypothetical protein